MSVPLDKVTEIFIKQKRVEGMIHGRSMPRQDIVETLVQRQHLAELHNLMTQLPTSEIGSILEALPVPDAKRLWEQIPQERENDVLWEVSDSRREQLVGSREPSFDQSQINAFELTDGKLRQIPVESRKNLEGIKAIWIDLLGATKAERAYVGAHFGLTLPDPGDVTDLEVSSRYHIEDNGEIYLHSNFLLDKEGNSRSVPVAFILHQGILFFIAERRTAGIPVAEASGPYPGGVCFRQQ